MNRRQRRMQNPVRAYWLECHRRLRIAVRETAKAALDVAIYGQGATNIVRRRGLSAMQTVRAEQQSGGVASGSEREGTQ